MLFEGNRVDRKGGASERRPTLQSWPVTLSGRALNGLNQSGEGFKFEPVTASDGRQIDDGPKVSSLGISIFHFLYPYQHDSHENTHFCTRRARKMG